MFKEISKGRYEIIIDGQPKEIVISFGLKKELYKVISKGQLESTKLIPKVYMSDDDRQFIAVLLDKLNRLKTDTPEDTQAITEATVDLDSAYAKALLDLENRQQSALYEASVKHIDLAGDVMAEGLAILLSDYDRQGKVTTKVTTEDILWDPKYAEVSEVLLELLTAVTEYITSALKKISGLKEMIDSTVNPQERKAEDSLV